MKSSFKYNRIAVYLFIYFISLPLSFHFKAPEIASQSVYWISPFKNALLVDDFSSEGEKLSIEYSDEHGIIRIDLLKVSCNFCKILHELQNQRLGDRSRSVRLFWIAHVTTHQQRDGNSFLSRSSSIFNTVK